jgi:hypothetical protein
MYCNSYYLTANKHLLQKFISVFRDISLCLQWLFISPWINAHYSHAYFSLLNTPPKDGQTGPKNVGDCHIFVYKLLNLWKKVLLDKLTDSKLVKKFPAFTEPEGSLPH